jgi:predicted NBD/HSP70 family sugar kinase
MLLPRHRAVLQAVLRHGAPSRGQLHELTGIRRMTVYEDADRLLEMGILREGRARRLPRGRPEVPLEIDPARRNVIGLAIGVGVAEQPGAVELVRLNLLGEECGPGVVRTAKSAADQVRTAADLLRRSRDKATLAVGVLTRGLIDPAGAAGPVILASPLSSAKVSLRDVWEAAGEGVPVTLSNDVQALAARWLLAQTGNLDQDVLVVSMDDGRLGAAFLVGGRPNQGCVMGANELGHTRLLVETDRCYCGGMGCIERVFSTSFLTGLGGPRKALREAIADFDGRDDRIRRIVDLVGLGVANAV